MGLKVRSNTTAFLHKLSQLDEAGFFCVPGSGVAGGPCGGLASVRKKASVAPSASKQVCHLTMGAAAIPELSPDRDGRNRIPLRSGNPKRISSP